MSPRLASLVLLLAAAGCADRTTARSDPASARTVNVYRPATATTKLDILFVIDDSGSMREEQANLTRNFPRLLDVLGQLPDGLPDVHIGVVSTNVGAGGDDASCPTDGDNGRLQVRERCQGLLTGGEPYLRSAPRLDGSRDANFTGELPDVFACMAELGTEGCGFEQPLEAMRRALDGRNPENDGFLRDDAFLAVVVISDEDDCSATSDALFGPASAALGPRSSFRCFAQGVTCDQGGSAPGERTGCVSNESSDYLAPVAEYVQFLKDLKGPTIDDDASIVVAGIHGLDPTTLAPGPVRVGTDPQRPNEPALLPACSIDVGDGTGGAAPGVRLSQFLASFPDRSSAATICNDSLAGALAILGELIKISLVGRCMQGPLTDVSPDLDGVQYDCAVSLVTEPGTSREVSRAVPPCTTADAGEMCWELEPVGWCAEDEGVQTVLRNPAQIPRRTFERWQCRADLL
jgi:hypothetical protein